MNINNLKYIDIHSHPNFHDFDQDRELVMSRAKETGVGMIVIGTDLNSSRSALDMAHKYENVWATVGMHPIHDDHEQIEGVVNRSIKKQEIDKELLEIEKLAQDPKVVAIGECGLDYFHINGASNELEQNILDQEYLFREQIKIANKVGKPLMLHVRDSKDHRKFESKKESAYQKASKIIQEFGDNIKANFHFFVGSKEDLDMIIKMGHTVSFTGVLTFTKDYDQLIKDVPISNIMSETDCPYVAPVPYRGKRNEPGYVVEVVKAIARIRGEDEEVVRLAILENAKKFIFSHFF